MPICCGKLPTQDGRTLYDNLVCDGKLRPDFAMVVDGLSLKADQLDKRLQGGEEVVTMAILRHLPAANGYRTVR